MKITRCDGWLQIDDARIAELSLDNLVKAVTSGDGAFDFAAFTDSALQSMAAELIWRRTLCTNVPPPGSSVSIDSGS